MAKQIVSGAVTRQPAFWLVLTMGLVPAADGHLALHARGDGAGDRHAIVLEYRTVSVVSAERPHSCAPEPSDLDELRGFVLQSDVQSTDPATVYEGVLARVTEQTRCGSEPSLRRRPTARAAHPCRARLSGVGDVHVRIKVAHAGHDLLGAWIVLTPADVMASVGGNCRPAEMQEMRAAYAERTTIEIRMPPGRLVPGRYESDAQPGEPGRWVLIVESKPWPSS
jgi:hypothetical protein